MSQSMENGKELSKSVKSRIERNRQKALAIRQSKLVSHPYAKSTAVTIDQTTIKIGTTKYKDTGGGFLLEEEPEKTMLSLLSRQFLNQTDQSVSNVIKHLQFHGYLIIFFSNVVMNANCDLDKHEPPLKYITRKNPHNVNWGEMKLYLRLQVEERALKVWGSEAKMEEERERREEKKVIAKTKKYHKQLKELRMNMRSSLYDRTSAAHVHEFGPETYNEEEDTYSRNCETCSYVETYEK
ncbi:DNA repair protein complementing XP-A cells -like, partial [Asbolus verrucosus]